MSWKFEDKDNYFWLMDWKKWKKRFEGYMPKEKIKAAWVNSAELFNEKHTSMLGGLRKFGNAPLN